jgi:hypothetical protein
MIQVRLVQNSNQISMMHMTEFIQTLLISNIYRILCLATGFAIAYLGYRLFMAGVSQRSGEGQGQFGNLRIMFKDMAPGSFFAFCGIIIAFLGAARPVTVERGAGTDISVTYPNKTGGIPSSIFSQWNLPLAFSFTNAQELASLRNKLGSTNDLTEDDRKVLIELISLVGSSSGRLESFPVNGPIISKTSAEIKQGQQEKKWYEFWKW